MILNVTLKKDQKTNKIISQPSAYNPSKEVKERTQQVIQDFVRADTIKNTPYREFNDQSLINRMNMDQASWNQYVTNASSDPYDAWKSTAFRPIVHNKIITIAAQITASIIYPKIYAQNDQDEEDKNAAMVLRDIMEWVADNSNYDQKFLKAVISMLVNPGCFFHTEFSEKYRTVKYKKADGSYDIKTILDEVFSGFQDTIVGPDEIWIANFYEPEIQKQPYIIWRKVIDFATAQTKYGDNPIFKEYVKPGVQYLYSDDQNMFYEEYDDELRENLVEEVVYFNRNGDLQLTLVNGILITDVDEPNPREDKLYPFAFSGYEEIHSRFFWKKSLAFKLSTDESIVNTLYRMQIDGTYLQTMPPAVLFGSEDVRSGFIAPGMVTAIADAQPNASFQTIQTNNNLAATQAMLAKVESSISESSASDLSSGNAPAGASTAYEISRLEQNARVMLGLFGKMVAHFVKQIGILRVSDILQFVTVGEVQELSSGKQLLKFRKFLMPEKVVDGKRRTRRIEFDAELPDEMTDDELMEQSLKIAEKEVETDDKLQIIKVNPTLFRKLKFMVRVTPEALLPKSDALQKALNLEAYGLAIANPLANAEVVTRDLLFGSFEKTADDPDKYMKQPDKQSAMPGPVPTPDVAGAQAGMLEEANATNPMKMAGKL